MNISRRILLQGAVGLNFLDTPFAPTSAYEVKRVEGWQIVVSKELSRKYPRLCADVLKLLGHKLHGVARVVPPHALPKLRQVRIWAEYDEGHHPCMVYHPDAGWLKEHGMNPEKAGCVEIAGAEKFLAWEYAQPYMVLHELAHAYHNQVLGDDNAIVKSAYEGAVASKKYESVTYIQGGQQRHYALTNPQEYFAELTESYFGTNDFYPFVRPELFAHDPVGYRCIETVWGIVSRLSIVTPLGSIAIEVDNRLAPVTAANFMRYVDEGYYTKSHFHRTVKPDNQPNNPIRIEVIQASIPPENGKKDFPPIPLERTTKTTLRHKEGTLSMARLEPDTATCEFFICIGDQPALDFGGKRNPDGQGFAAFGRVVQGMEVVRKIQQAPAKEQDLTPPVPILEIRRRL